LNHRRIFVPPDDARRLVVVADSLAFCDSKGPQLPDHPTLYPNRVAEALSNATGQRWATSVVARAGADVRDAWRWVSKDRHVKFELVAPADALIIAIGSFDHAPMGVPRWMEVMAGYMHPTAIRRTYRRGLHTVYPWVASATRGRFARTAPAEFERMYRLLLRQIVGLTQASAPVVAMGPTTTAVFTRTASNDARLRLGSLPTPACIWWIHGRWSSSIRAI
jgi:hypothetical protein